MKPSILSFIRHRACPVRRVVWGVPPVGALFAAAALLCGSGSSIAADEVRHFKVEVFAQPLLLSSTAGRFKITGYPEGTGASNLASADNGVLFDLYQSREEGLEFNDPLNSKGYYFMHIQDTVKKVDHRLVFALTERPCTLVTLANLAADLLVLPGLMLELSILTNDADGRRPPLTTPPQKVCTSKKTALELVFFPEYGGFLPLLINVGNGDENTVTYSFSVPL